jgi:hypothetical protein
MSHWRPKILVLEFNEHMLRIQEWRHNHAETMATTRKAIDESLALMAEIDAIIARR